MRFYVSTFPDVEIHYLDRYGSDDPDGEGTVKGATFRIADQTLRCIDSPDVHPFGFTAAGSFFFDCPDEATFNALFDRFSDQGTSRFRRIGIPSLGGLPGSATARASPGSSAWSSTSSWRGLVEGSGR